MNLHELAPVMGSTHVNKRKAPALATARPQAAGTRARRLVRAVNSASALKAARCLWLAASRSAVSTTSSLSP